MSPHRLQVRGENPMASNEETAGGAPPAEARQGRRIEIDLSAWKTDDLARLNNLCLRARDYATSKQLLDELQDRRIKDTERLRAAREAKAAKAARVQKDIAEIDRERGTRL